MRKTRIIATIGPASADRRTLKALITAGVNVCRLNFSFGDHACHRANIDLIRSIGCELGRSVAIMQDLQGPKIRIGHLNGPVTLRHGDQVVLSGNTVHRSERYLPTTYRNIAADTEPGKTLLLADGRIILTVTGVEKSRREVHCRVVSGGTVLTGKGINLPYTHISMPALTEKDLEDAKFGIAAGVDYMALSFVRRAADVMRLKRLIKAGNMEIPIIAKLEKPEALDNLAEILAVVDGVMVARGDLADEISFEHVPMAQKNIVRRANEQGKLSIVATEMLGSMTENPLPTRAEVSDVANAVLDGADMIMLSNETAAGKYPVKAVQTMSAIAVEAEKMLRPESEPALLRGGADQQLSVTSAMCLSASFLSHELNARAILVLTTTGRTAKILAKYRPRCVIYAATYHERIYHRMAACHNVFPLLLEGTPSADADHAHQSYSQVLSLLRQRKLAKKGDCLIVLAGISGPDACWRLNEIQTITV
ncbi:MAG: pyruvate kinase [Victivallales bacterium]|nr:pyruvate kinase [Victivallales bacterium]